MRSILSSSESCTFALSVQHAMLDSGTRLTMKSKSAAQNEPSGREPSEFERFTEGLRKVLSVRKSDLDLHKPIRPRKNGAAKPISRTS